MRLNMGKCEYDAVIVLGGGRNPEDGSLTQLSKARLDRAAQAIKEGQAGFVVVMGGYYRSYIPEAGLFSTDRAVLAGNYLLNECEVSGGRILTISRECRDTIYEAIASRGLAEEKNWGKVLVDTSIGHISRATYAFRRIYESNIQVDPIKEACNDKLNFQQEYILFRLTIDTLSRISSRINDPGSWDLWYRDQRSFYDKQEGIYELFRSRGVESREAYASIHPENG